MIVIEEYRAATVEKCICEIRWKIKKEYKVPDTQSASSFCYTTKDHFALKNY